MSRRGDVLVRDGRAHHDPVVARPEPALAFRQVHLQAALEHVRLAAVGLHAGEEAVLVRPADVGLQEPLLEELDHGAVEVVAGPAHGVGAGGVVARVVAVEDEGQVRREVVAAPPRELGGQVVRPVRVVELEAVHEARAQRAAQPLAEPPAEGGGEARRHVVEVAADRGGAPVVHHRPVRARRTELHVREARLEEPHVEDVGSRRDAHPDASFPQRARAPAPGRGRSRSRPPARAGGRRAAAQPRPPRAPSSRRRRARRARPRRRSARSPPSSRGGRASSAPTASGSARRRASPSPR